MLGTMVKEQHQGFSDGNAPRDNSGRTKRLSRCCDTAGRLIYARRLIDTILKDHGNSKMCERNAKSPERMY